MEHTMRLAAEPFQNIKNGSKTIELRLYDEKRKQIKTGDEIVFTNLESPHDTLRTRVTDVCVFPSFEALYAAIPLEDIGYCGNDTGIPMPSDMERFYSRKEQAQYGVVGFRLALCNPEIP